VRSQCPGADTRDAHVSVSRDPTRHKPARLLPATAAALLLLSRGPVTARNPATDPAMLERLNGLVRALEEERRRLAGGLAAIEEELSRLASVIASREDLRDASRRR
jgi:hypothetical protein